MKFAPHITSTKELRKLNQHRILRAIYFNEPVSRQDLREYTDLSTATITNLTAKLIAEGIVVEAGTVESQGGRPRVLLTINKEYGYFIGVDLGETHIRFELFDIKMELKQSITYWLDEECIQPEEVIEKIVAGYQVLLADSGLPEDKIIGIGIGVPGVVERDGGISVVAPNWGWHNVSLLSQLKEKIAPLTILDNGAKAMSLAEMWFGTGKGYDNLIALLIGTGVGTGIIWNGLLLRGLTNSAGEWGHTTLALDGRPCRCGGKGCLETYIGANGIAQTLRESVPDSPILNSENQLRLLQNIAMAVEQGEESARWVIRETTRFLGAGIANLINLYNPRLIVLGGWVSDLLAPYFLEQLPEFVAQYALQRPLAATEILASQLGENAIAMGSACLVLEDFLNGRRSTWRLSSEKTRPEKLPTN